MIKNELKVEINIIKKICKMYLEIKEILMDTPKTKMSRDIHKSYKKSLTKIDTVLVLLPKQEYEYIVKTFITKVRIGWWKEIYKSDEYEKVKNAAIKRFIYLYLI